MDSIWLKTSEKPHYDTLDGNKKTDVLNHWRRYRMDFVRVFILIL